jgi:predicted SPOUT superfamily RNA methylase MTH1
MEAFLGIIIGVLVTLGVVTYFKRLQKKKLANSQSVILLDKIRTVCKFITVEGDFAEIYHYEDVKEKFLKLISSKKKALVVINAKAHVGFDFSKVKMEANANNKTVILQHFPQPEVLSIETNLNYYDKSDGYFNKFEATDLTDLHSEAKKHIQDKIPESGLYEIAGKEALETVLLIENIVQTIGWKLDYTALKIEDKPPKIIEE